VACDLRTRLVQWVRDAAHSPDARAEVCRILCMYIWKTHDSHLMPLVPMSDHRSPIENVNQFSKESPSSHPGCELRTAAMEPAGFAGHRPPRDLRRASDAGVLHQRSLWAHASPLLLDPARLMTASVREVVPQVRSRAASWPEPASRRGRAPRDAAPASPDASVMTGSHVSEAAQPDRRNRVPGACCQAANARGQRQGERVRAGSMTAVRRPRRATDPRPGRTSGHRRRTPFVPRRERPLRSHV